MIIGVAGPYSADTEEKRKTNLDAMNIAAAKLLELGHIPLIGMNAALPVIELANIKDKYKAAMEISLDVIDKCEGLLMIGESQGLLMIGESPGANKERDLILSKGLPVYYNLDDIPLVR